MYFRTGFFSLCVLLVAGIAGMCCMHMKPIRSGGQTDYCGDRMIDPSGAQLAVPHIPQRDHPWCWSAVIAMVSAYYGNRVPLCQIATEKIRRKVPSADCCDEVGTRTSTAICNQGGMETDFDNALTARGLWYKRVSRPLHEWELQLELSNGRPVILTVSSTVVHHVVVVGGFQTKDGGRSVPALYTVHDPALPEPTNGVPFSGLQEGLWRPYNKNKLPMRDAWTRLSTRKDGCSIVFDPFCNCGAPVIQANRQGP